MKVIYEERCGFKIEPLHEGNKPIGFNVIRTGTGEFVENFVMLHEAEEYIRGHGNVLGKLIEE